ncbi:MAG: biotin transporter BioY [Rhodospirillales bacterium]|nr:biotin transporter BioY [Rhodospirillales bacterium]
MAQPTEFNTLANTLWPTSADQHSWLRNLMLVFTGSVLLAISAKINIPFYPVPMTMQTFMVLCIGMAFGWRLGGATLLLYLGEGALGLPVFAGTPEKGIGLAYLMGPTGGYLFGFFVAAVTVGWLAEKGWDRNMWTTLAAMIIGTAIIFILGLLYLGVLYGWDKPILEWGLIPFLPGAGFKIGLAAAVLPLTWKYLVERKDRES